MPYLHVDNVAVSEGSPSAVFEVRLDVPSLNEVRVAYGTSNGSAVGGADVQGQTGTLVFAPGELRKTVTVLLVDDTRAEGVESFWLNLASPVNATLVQASATATIFDNDATPGTPAISVQGLDVDESQGTARFVVALDRPSPLPVSVAYGTESGTALEGQDFVAAHGLLNFAPGEMVKTVTVDLVDDAAAESDESFALQLGAPAAATLAHARGLATIVHNDAPPTGTPQITMRPVVASEGDPWVDFLVTLAAPSLNEVRVNFGTSNGSAVGGADVQGRTGTLVFAPGQTAQNLRVLLVDDAGAEKPEAFWLNLASPVNATLDQASTTATLFDDDGTAGTPALSVGDAIVDESGQRAQFAVWLDRPSLSTVSVDFTTADDTAGAGTDYRSMQGTLTFAPGEMVRTVEVDLIDDTVAETDELFQLLLSNPRQATLADGVGGALIGLSDTAPVSQPRVLVVPAVGSEGDIEGRFVVQLSAPSTHNVRVNFGTANGTALGGSDVQGRTGTLSFDPGQTTLVVRTLLVDDTVPEPTESYWFDLGSPVNATVPQARSSHTIVDDDGALVHSHGIGNDRYEVNSASDRIAEAPGGGIDTVMSGVSYILPEQVERLVLSGTAALSATGNAGDNVLRGNVASNLLDGQGGIDTAVFGVPRASATLEAGPNGSRLVTAPGEGTDQLFGIERLQFADAVLASDTTAGGHTYGAYAMLRAAFDRAPTTAELSRWTAMLDRLDGSTLELAQVMINAYAPGVSNDALVSYLWSTIVGGTIPADALATYTGLIVGGSFTQASLVDFVAGHPLNTVEIASIVGTTIELDPAWFPPPAA
ncbi:MAG: Calx-beta domain-containing protein [Rubrivivax sp.]